MRNSFPVLTAVLLLGLAAASGGSQESREAISLEVGGMTCGSCAAAITAALSNVEGVAEAEVDFEGGLARVSFDPTATTPAALAAMIEKLGYSARMRPSAEGDGPQDAVPAGGAQAASCASPPAPAEALASTLSAAEIERVADYIAGVVLETGRTGFEDDEIEEATGIVVGDANGPAVRQAVMAKINATEAGRRMLAGSRCNAYEACSLYGDLSGADGEILAMYEREKAEDGRTFDDFELPEFQALDLAGNEVSSADLRGRPALLAFLAVHCSHSIDSLPILQDLNRTYGPRGLRVVAIAINSGEVEDVNTWFPSFNPEYEVWVASGDALGDRIGSHLVPTYLFVDAEGRITEKLVGFKESTAVTERVLARIAEPTEETREIASR